MVLSGAEYSMAIMTAFPLSLVVILSSDPFSINIDILGFSQNCSYTVLALSFRGTSDMPRTESSSAMSQDYLDFYYTSSTISLLGSSLGPQCKNGSGPQILGPHNNNNNKTTYVLILKNLYVNFFFSTIFFDFFTVTNDVVLL